MAEGQLKRRLAAILAADAAGYARLMAEDERATVAALDAARRVFERNVEANQGRVIDTAGDSVLALFDSAAGAATAALAVQGALDQDAATQPQARRLRFRIGIHLGDIFEKDDGSVYGDGVNIAARLQALAVPGGVTVSEAVHGAIRGRVAASATDRGLQRIKNIPQPIRAYELAAARGAAAAAAQPREAMQQRPSIAVLAFDNMSGDAAQEHFGDGICEDIITDLSKINGLAVIGRQSAFAYKGRATDLRQVGRELGVRYLLEGSVRKAGNRVRVTAQLIEADSGTHLWANRYDRELDDVFLVGDEIAQDIVAALDIRLGRGEDSRIWRKALKSVEARDVFNRGWSAYSLSSPQDNRRARELFLEVIRLEPEGPLGHAYVAVTHVVDLMQGWSNDPAQSLEQVKRFGARAVALDEASPGGHIAQGVAALFEGRFQDALAEAERALELRPMCASPKAGLAFMQLYAGNYSHAIHNARDAIELNPVFPGWYLYLMAAAQHFGGQHEAALTTVRQVLAANPRLLFARLLRVAALDALGRAEDAREEAALVAQERPDFSVARFAATQPFRDQAQCGNYLDALRRAGLP